jgi:C4-dicarboxylate-specific signal transduction histidine kinase
MDKNEHGNYDLEEYKKLEEKYNHLIKKYQKLQSRFDTVVKFNDKQLVKMFKELAHYSKLDKRVDSIIRQSDRQISELLSQINEYAKIDKRFNIIVKHSDKQERLILDKKNEFEQKLEDEIALNQQQQKLIQQQSKLAAMGEMVGNIAHQFKQPLSVISTVSSHIEIKQMMGTLEDEDLLEQLKIINNSVNYLSNTIDDFRNFFSENKKTKDFLVSESLEKAYELLISRFHNAAIEFVCPKSNITIHGVQNEFLQVVMNIFSNAVDELKNKDDDDKILKCSITQDDQRVTVSINDNASGIDESIIDSIFDAHFSTKQEKEGSGIGLYMSKKIITENFNGNIYAKNNSFEYEGKNYFGADFIIELKKG